MFGAIGADCTRAIVPFQSVTDTIRFSRTCKLLLKSIWQNPVCNVHRLLIKELHDETDATFGPGECGIRDIEIILRLLRGKIKWGKSEFPYSHLEQLQITKIGCLQQKLVVQAEDCLHYYNPETKTNEMTPGFPPNVYQLTRNPEYKIYNNKDGILSCSRRKVRFPQAGAVAFNEKQGYVIIGQKDCLQFGIYALDDCKTLFTDKATRSTTDVAEPPVSEYKWTDEKEALIWIPEDEQKEMADVKHNDVTRMNRGKPASIQRFMICDDGFCVVVRHNRGGVPYSDTDYQIAYEWRIYYDNKFRRLGMMEDKFTAMRDDAIANVNMHNPIITKQFVWDCMSSDGTFWKITPEGMTESKIKIKKFGEKKQYVNYKASSFTDSVRLQLISGTPILAHIPVNWAGFWTGASDDKNEMRIRFFHYRLRNNTMELFELCNSGWCATGTDNEGFNKNIIHVTEDFNIMAMRPDIPDGVWKTINADSIELTIGKIVSKIEPKKKQKTE